MELPSGVTLRQWTRDDLAPMAELINERVGTEGVGEFATADVLAEVYDHRRNCDPVTDITVAVDGVGCVVGYARSMWLDMGTDGSVRNHYCAFEATAGIDGLDAAMAGWAIDRNRAIAAARSGADDGPEAQLVAHAIAGTRRAAVLDATGLRPTAWSVGARRALGTAGAPAARPLPDGLEVRPVHADHLRAIWEADVAAFRDDRDFFEHDETDFDRFVAEADNGSELWQVAWDGDTVAGQVRTHVTPGESERRGGAAGVDREHLDARRVAPARRRVGADHRQPLTEC